MPGLITLFVFLAVTLLGLPARVQLPPMPTPAAVPQPAGSLGALIAEVRFPGGRPAFFTLVGLGSVMLFVSVNLLLHSTLVAIALSTLGFLGPYFWLLGRRDNRRRLLDVQFKEVLASVAGSLRAGASLQTALERALGDTQRVFAHEPDCPIAEELEELVGRLRLGVPVDVALAGWRDRLGTEDVADFVSATVTVKEQGGNLAEVMTTVADTIAWKIIARAQIQAITAEKRYEANLLMAGPTVILVLLSLTSRKYMEPMLTTTIGQVLMVVGFALNLLAFVVTRKLLSVVDL